MMYRDLDEDIGRATAADLISQLSKLDPDTPIFVPGYEGGFHDAALGDCIKVKINANAEWYYGPHEDSDDAEVAGFLICGKTAE